MATLTLTRGLPASGKTTWARAWQAEHPEGRARVNRDNLRAQVFGGEGVLPWAVEQQITAMQQAIVRTALAAGMDIVVDDMNLRAKYARVWADLAHAVGADFAVHDLIDVPLEACIERDAKRQREGYRHVGEKVIRDLHGKFLASGRLPDITGTPAAAGGPARQYIPDEMLPLAWLVDVDGTLARMVEGGRGPYDWHRVGEDEPNGPVLSLVTALADQAAIVVMSGRDESCRAETEAWLHEHGVSFDVLLMRLAGDSRKDSVVKSELFWKHVASNWSVRGVVDDRNQVVDMWRNLGLMCAQVAPGDF
jgi:predicted kinase